MALTRRLFVASGAATAASYLLGLDRAAAARKPPKRRHTFAHAGLAQGVGTVGITVVRTHVVTPSEWPDANNTGVPAGTSLTPTSGLIDSVSNGEIIEALDVNPGTIRIRHDNVTVRKCKITADASFFGPIDFDGAHTGTIVEDCEFDGADTIGSGAGGSGVTYRRCKIHRMENGWNVSGGATYRDNYLFDFIPYNPVDDPHIDGWQFNEGASNVTIEHNVMDCTGTQTSAGLTFYDIAGTAHSNVLVNNNKILLDAAGGYTIRNPGMDCSGNNVVFTNNRLTSGGFGYHAGNVANLTTWSGNVDDVTDDPVT
jgi:hypothetical protein